MDSLRTNQGLNPLNVGSNSLGRIPQVHRTLRIEPELGRVAEQTRKPERHSRTYRTMLTNQLVDRLA